MRRIPIILLVVLAVAGPPAGVGNVLAANYAQETLDRNFRIEFDVASSGSRATISGYVYNQHAGYTADRMRLAIERLDAAGKVIGTSGTWVLGGVPPSSRSYFTTRVEPAASYRVQIESFDWTGRGGGSN